MNSLENIFHFGGPGISGSSFHAAAWKNSEAMIQQDVDSSESIEWSPRTYPKRNIPPCMGSSPPETNGPRLNRL